MIAAVTEQIGTEGYGFLEVSGSGELQTSTNLVRLIVGIDTGEDAYRWGMVTLSNILSVVPRAIWPDRPLTGAELFVETFYPGVLESGGGYGCFIFQDPYWDFGFLGVFAFAFGLALAMRKFYVGLILNNGSPFWVLLYTIVYSNMVIAVVRSGIYAGIKNSLISVVPLLLISAITSLRNGPLRRPFSPLYQRDDAYR
jgi:oligosaccharide repeat unit polymerase